MTKIKKPRMGPDSPVQKKFLDSSQSLVIYGGGAKHIWPITE